jgi:hypothetical protein
MNTISSVVTFLIQNPPSRVSAALRVTAARERLARVERLSESELSIVREEIEKDGE